MRPNGAQLCLNTSVINGHVFVMILTLFVLIVLCLSPTVKVFDYKFDTIIVSQLKPVTGQSFCLRANSVFWPFFPSPTKLHLTNCSRKA